MLCAYPPLLTRVGRSSNDLDNTRAALARHKEKLGQRQVGLRELQAAQQSPMNTRTSLILWGPAAVCLVLSTLTFGLDGGGGRLLRPVPGARIVGPPEPGAT